MQNQYQMLTYHREIRESFQSPENEIIQKAFHQKIGPDSSHLTVLESIIIHISDFFKYNTCLGVALPRFPYREECVNEWFQVIEEDDEERKTIQVINIDGIKREERVYSPQYGIEYFNGLQDADYKILFHGTNHQGAQSIIEDGILLNRGAENQDFSSGKGFYLNSRFEEALQWACRRFNQPAVVVYKIERETLGGCKGLDLQGDENEREWEEIVHQFRSGIQDRKFLRSIYKQYDYIEGPMASISKKCKNTPSKYLKLSKKENSYQFCILSEKLAEEFWRSLHSLLFY